MFALDLAYPPSVSIPVLLSNTSIIHQILDLATAGLIPFKPVLVFVAHVVQM